MTAKETYLESLHLPPEGPDDGGTRARLLVAAVRMFAHDGYDTCTMRELAAAVGVKAPAIYNHYGSKQEVLAAAVGFVCNDFMTVVLSGLEDFPADERLFELARRHVRYKTDNLELARANDELLNPEFMARALPAAELRRITAALSTYRAIVRELISLASPGTVADHSVNGQVLTVAVIDVCDGVSVWFRPDGKLRADQVADHVCVLIRRLITPS